ncbi:MAG: exodeoxyribonuclease VII small subunit [Anaerolineae bacterium]|nr:exodeoxyribonuclease VII small subunit [Anaerolineae bacterium]
MSDEIGSMAFEQAFSALQEAVTRLESGEMTLEESVALYERGRLLAARCQALLDAAELRVRQVSGAN